MDFLKMDESFPQDNNTTPIEPSKKGSKAWLVFLILGLISMLGGVACVLVVFLLPKEELPDLEFPAVPSAKVENKYYSHLTGLPVADEAAISAPTYCIQTPNGTDGARPQAGLNEAGVIFEAIAEAGITRFAAIYQNPSAAVIGPIRSLRLYYLQWDTPFDCTIVHAGGADVCVDEVGLVDLHLFFVADEVGDVLHTKDVGQQVGPENLRFSFLIASACPSLGEVRCRCCHLFLSLHVMGCFSVLRAQRYTLFLKRPQKMAEKCANVQSAKFFKPSEEEMIRV